MIVEVGAGTDPDPRSETQCDLVDIDGIDEVFDIRDPWPFEDNSASGIIATHVFEHVSHAAMANDVFPEIYRVLEPGGWVEFTVPLGGNQAIDPTHDQNGQWEWSTVDYYTGDRRVYYYEHHDWQFSIADREMRVWCPLPFPFNIPVGLCWRAIKEAHKDAAGMLPVMVGELTVRLEATA